MKQRIKHTKTLLLVLLALLLVVQLGACGNTSPAAEAEQPRPAVEETDEATAEEREEAARELVEQGWDLIYPDSGEPDYAAARPLFEQAAELGNADALNELGLMYNDGNGVEQDYGKARAYYEQAAELGSQYAMCNLGWMYEHGQGVEADGKKAAALYEQAAELGNADAMRNLAQLYYDGNGVEQDYKKAAAWFQKAADLGNDEAMFSIGYMYKNGEGVEQDYGKAREYYELAAERGNYMAMNNLGVLYENALGVSYDHDMVMYWYEKSDTMRHVEELRSRGWEIPQEKALTWDLHAIDQFLIQAVEEGNLRAICDFDVLQEHHNNTYLDRDQVEAWGAAAREQGDATALRGIGRLYHNNNGVPRDLKRAEAYYKEAAELGDPDGMLAYAGMLEYDHVEQAMEWLERAIDLGSVDAIWEHGCVYMNNEYGVKDYQKALEWFVKSYEAGHPDGCLYAAYACEYMEDYEQALSWYRRGAEEQNSGACMFMIYKYYRDGRVVEKDPELAAEWRAKALATGLGTHNGLLVFEDLPA